MTGLLGSGFDELPYLLFGARPCFGGRAAHARRHVPAVVDDAAARAGRRHGAHPRRPPARRRRRRRCRSASNVMMQVLGDYQPHEPAAAQDEQGGGRAAATRFDVRPSDPKRIYQSLSGGNQQKALLAKWMQTDPGLVLLHEPTQGVDVGAREQIFRMLSAAAAEGGMSILCASSDYEQLAAICDRVLVDRQRPHRARADGRRRRQGPHRRAGLQQRHARRGGVREDRHGTESSASADRPEPASGDRA